MKNLQKYGLLFFAMTIFFSSCEDDAEEIVDTTAPTIDNVEYPESVEAGNAFLLKFTLQDEVGLGTVQLEIHDDFDGHDHENARLRATPFSYSNVLDEMRGMKEFPVEEIIEIPAEATTGPYHLQISYLDAAGNEGVYYVGEFEIVSEGRSPVITITNFEEGEELHPTTDENGFKLLYLEGSIESQVAGGLEEVHITVQHEEEDHTHGRRLQEEAIYDQEWELAGEQTFDLQDISPVIDLTNAEEGHYELSIMARDMEGNIKILSREIHVE